MLNKASQNELRFKLAEIVISVCSPNDTFMIPSVSYQTFVSPEKPSVKLKLSTLGLPSLSGKRLIFDSEGSWDMYQENGFYQLNFYSFEPGRKRYKSALFSADFTYGDIYFDYDTPASYFRHPLEYPLDEVLMVQLLALGRGIMTHACGIDFQGKGVLFVGASGQGKSTLAKLFKDKGRVLSDDRIILREVDKKFSIYGTPWHGDANVFCSGSAPLSVIFFIRHANENFTRRLNAIEAARRLIAGSFCPYWYAGGMDFSLRLCEQLFNRIPAYELGFLPEQHIWSFLQDKI